MLNKMVMVIPTIVDNADVKNLTILVKLLIETKKTVKVKLFKETK